MTGDRRRIGDEDSDPQRVLVVGAGLGGLRVVQRLRSRGFTGEIVVLGAEKHPPYDRPPLSKQALHGQSVDLALKSSEELLELGADFRLDTRATGMTLDKQIVHTTVGDVAYDVAVIATGAVPRRIPGADGLVLRTLEDAQTLTAAFKDGARLVVVGAGLIGCEVAATARSLGVEVSLVDVMPAPAVRVLGTRVGGLLGELHAQHGVEMHLGTGLSEATLGRVRLNNGTILEADVLLQAIGVVPDTDWLTGSGVAVSNGIVCDADGRAAPGVFAVGDVANWAGIRHEHWTKAGEQADHVAAVLLGQEPPPADVEYWWSDQYGLKLQGLGSPGPDDDVDVITWGAKERTIAVYSAHGRLTGLVGFSAPGAIMRLRPDVAAGSPVAGVLDRLAAGTR